MSRAVVVSRIAQRKVGRLGAVAWGSVVAVLVTLSLVLVGEGAPGDLDPTPGVGGKVITDFGGDDLASALVRQPDGKLVAAGYSQIQEDPITVIERFALARYRPDGRLDPTFGVGGRVITEFGFLAEAWALVL